MTECGHLRQMLATRSFGGMSRPHARV